MKNGQAIFEFLSQLTEEQRKACAFEMLDHITIAHLVENARGHIVNNYIDPEDDFEWCDKIAEATSLCPEEISEAIDKTNDYCDTGTCESFFDMVTEEITDRLIGAMECKIPIVKSA